MLETIATIGLILITWINISRFYMKRKIGNSLRKVEIGKPLRVPIHFSHYLKYFEIKDLEEGEIIVFEFQNKNIKIGADGKETVLYIDDEE